MHPPPLWGRVYPGQRRQDRNLGVVPTAVGRHEAGPTGTARLHRAVAECTRPPLWGRVYPGPRRQGRNLGAVPTAVGRHEAGPTGTARLHRAVAECTRPLCGAGFIPASGGRTAT